MRNSQPLLDEAEYYCVAAKVSSGPDAIGWSFILRGGGYNGIYFRIHKYPPRYSAYEIVPSVDYTSNVTDGNWHHFAAKRSSGTVTIYLDGNEIGSRSGSNQDVTNSAPLYLGTFGARSYNKLNASIDEFRVWNRALSEQEIKASYNSQLNPLSLRFTDLADGLYNYYAYVIDTYGNSVKTKAITLNISSGS